MRVTLSWLAAALLVAATSAAPVHAEEKDDTTTAKLPKEVKQILKMTNAERAEAKLPPLKLSPVLTRAAQQHSEDMARRQRLAHTLGDRTPADRIKDAGYQFSSLGENIAYGMDPSQAVPVWMKSKGHRSNILSENYTEIGIGVAKDADGRYYYTQKFARPRRR